MVGATSKHLSELYHLAKAKIQVDITKDDTSSADQLREAFRGMAGEKVSYSGPMGFES